MTSMGSLTALERELQRALGKLLSEQAQERGAWQTHCETLEKQQRILHGQLKTLSDQVDTLTRQLNRLVR